MRDCSKRFTKQEITTPSNVHSIVARSCAKRIPSVDTIIPTGSDWSMSLGAKTLKRSVFDSTRATDLGLGVNTTGLTRKKAESNLTKPHIFQHRLSLLHTLHGLWKTCPNRDEFVPDAEFRKLWLSCLMETGVLIDVDLPTYVGRTFIVLTGGPYFVSCMELDAVPEPQGCCTVIGSFEKRYVTITVTDITKVKVATTSPCVLQSQKQLGWKMVGDWMTLPQYVAFVSIGRIAAKLLYSLCSLCKIKGHSKLDHKRRVELYLRHHECDEEYINQVLSALPEKAPRKKGSGEKNHENADDDDEGENEEEDIFLLLSFKLKNKTYVCFWII